MGYNYHGKRNGRINNRLLSMKYLRCREEEDWQYVILCQGINEMKEQYLKDVRTNLKKITTTESENETVELIVGDLETYLKEEDKDFVTMQHIIGMELVFKGWIVKN